MSRTCQYENCERGCYGEFCLMHKPRQGLPKPKGTITRLGKSYGNWRKTKEAWYDQNPPDFQGYYYCHYCGRAITKDESTLDHKLIRSSYPQFRYDLGNLLICCWADNSKRGSMEYERFCARYYPHLVNKAVDNL